MLDLSRNPEMVEEVDCLFCGSGRKSPLKEWNELRISRCLDCGLTYTDRRLNAKGLELFYQEGYFTGQRKGSFKDYESERREKLIDFRHKYGFLKRYSGTGKLLDVGCATGISLEAARAEGFDPEGVEVSAWAAAQNRSGLPVQNMDLNDLEEGPRYDAISLWDVFEHLLDPDRSFGKLGALLREGGWLVFTYPDPTSLLARFLGKRWSILDPEEHSVFCSPRLVEAWLSRHGLRKTRDGREKRHFTLRKLAQKTIPSLESHYKFFLKRRFSGIEERIVIERGDTRDKLHLAQTIYKYRPERIVHLAGLPIADLSNRFPDETVSTIVNSTVNILDILKGVDFVRRFVLISSSMVYGDFQYVPADEEHPKNPKEVYGGTKLAAEILTRAYSQRFGVPYTIIRPSAVYGPTDVNNRVSQSFIFNAFLGKPLLLHNGGSTMLDFTYVTDTAHGICLATLASAAEGETFNITRGEGRSLKEYAEILRGFFPDLRLEHAKAELFRPNRGALDISKARDLLGYEPEHSLESGLAEYVKYLERNFPEDLERARRPSLSRKAVVPAAN